MKRLEKTGVRLLAIACVATLASACDTQLGVIQGAGLTESDSTFTGINGATVLSPTSVKVSWNTSSQYNTYEVFSSASTVPIGNTIFSSYTITGLTPDTNYSFSVGGQSSSSSTIDGVSSSLSIHTWPQFGGVSSVVATGSNSLQASWTYKDSQGHPVVGPTFNVYVTAGTGMPSFSTPATSTTSTVAGITQLANGTPIAPNTTYTVVVRATYLDNTNEFNTNGMSVATPSNIQPLPTLSADRVILGKWPSINVSGGLSSYVTSFQTASQTLGSILGNGLFKTPTAYPLNLGSNTVTPTITYNGASVILPSFDIFARAMSPTEIAFPTFYGVSGPSGTTQPRGAQRMGHMMAAGDFNCDGYMDLAVSAPWGTFNPLRSWGTSDGAVYVFYGSSTGLVTSPDPSVNPSSPTDPLLLIRPNVSLSYGGNSFGNTMASGNLNADINPANSKSCDDLAVGTAINGTSTGIGEVWVFFGSPNGLQTGSSVANSAACNGSSCSPLQIFPPNGSWTRQPYFGEALAIGNVHTPVAGDTYKDLIIGGPGESAGNNYGSVWIYYGGSAGINFISPPTATPPYTKIVAPAMTSTLPIQASYNFGTSVAAVDLDGDGIDDLVVGAPADNTNNFCYAGGAAYYYSSRANGGGFTSTSTVGQKLVNPMYTQLTGTCGSYNKFGGTLANGGDLNGDGYPDLVVGDNFYMAGWTWGWATYGATVYYGSTTGPQTGNGCVTTGDKPNQGSCITHATTACTPVGGGNPASCKVQNLAFSNTNSQNYWYANLYGIWVAAANGDVGQDVNHDGYADLAVGYPLDSANASVAMLYYGSSAGVQAAPSKLKPLVVGAYDNLGWSVALGDFNGDAHADVAVSAPDNMTLNGAYGGVVFEFNGQNGGLPSNQSSYNQMITANDSKEGYSMSWAAQAGDLNGDGYTDAFVSYHRRAVDNRPNNSYIYYGEADLIIYYGSPDGLVTSPQPSMSPLHPTDPLIVPPPFGPGNVPNLPLAAAAGDTNGDGFDDIAVSDGTYVFVYFGSTSGLQVSAQPSVPPINGLNPVIIMHFANAVNSDGIDWGYPGAAMSAADLNGDGYSDIALSGHNALSSGEVVVVYGSAVGPQTDGTLDHTIAGGADVVLTNPCTGTVPNLTCKAQLLLGFGETGWGESVAAIGDLNADGYGDLLVGSPLNAIAGTNNGAAYLFYGSPTGLQLWQGTASGFVIVPPAMLPGETGREAGTPVAPAGDVNGDGYADFILSSAHDNASWGSGGGAFLFYGCGNGMNNSATSPGCPQSGIQGVATSAAPPLATSVAVNAQSCTNGTCQPLYFYPTSVSTITGSWPGYYWGMTVGTVGDVNSDGYTDVVIGTYNGYQYCTAGACPQYYIQNGAAVLYTGSVNGLSVNKSVSTVPSCNGGVCTPYWLNPSMTNWGSGTNAAYYQFSYYTSFNNPKPADFNGDGHPDFLINTQHYLDSTGVSAFQGGMYIFQ